MSYRHALVVALLLMPALSVVGLTACDAQKLNPDTTSGSNMSFSAAIVSVQKATNLKVSRDMQVIDLWAYEPSMLRIQQYLSQAVLKNTTIKMRTIVANGVTTTVEVTIPYAYGYFLTFELDDGTELWFNCAGEEIWYETDDAIYQASCSADFGAFLGELMEDNGE